MTQDSKARGWWRDQTFLDDLRFAAREHPGKTAVVTHRGESGDCTSLSYAELSQLTDRCAAALGELGLKPGDVLAVQLSNRWELAPLALGCARAGVRICILLPVYQRRELEVMLAVSQARALITMTESGGYRLGELGMDLARQLPTLERVLISDGTDGANGPDGADGALGFEDFFFSTAWEERHELPAQHESGPDGPFLILFTSGTTGEPKGAVHSQNTLYAAIRGEADVFGLDASDRVMTTASYTHYTGFVQGMMMPLMLGGTMVFHELSAAGPVLDLMSRHGVTFLYAAPWFLRNLADEQRANGRGGIRVTGRARDVIMHHAFIVPVTEMEALLERHPAVRQASVIGLPVGQGEEETICAVVVPDDGAGRAPSLAELHGELREAGLMELFWPERLEIVDVLPMTATGKVRKVELQQRFAPA